MYQKWMEHFSPHYVLWCIDTGSPMFLTHAFVWRNTPEGDAYWRTLWEEDASLSTEVRDRLEAMLNEYRYAEVDAFLFEDDD